MIKNIKNAIDFALYTATPSSWEDSGNHISKLGTYLQLCQDQINSMTTTPTKIDPKSDTKLKELKRKVKDKIKALESKKTAASKSELKELDKRITELKDAQREIEILIKSVTKYKFQIDSKPQFDYDKRTDTGTIKYSGTMGSLLNELKHAFQFEVGEIDFIETTDANGKKSVSAGLLYDLQDEIATYKRQYAYDGYLQFKVELTEQQMLDALTTKKISITDLGTVEIKKMKRIKARVIIKVSDSPATHALYKTLSRKPLDRNSTMRDIRSGNRRRKETLNNLGVTRKDKKTPYIEYIKVYSSTQNAIHVKL